jgi:hypothetical protein
VLNAAATQPSSGTGGSAIAAPDVAEASGAAPVQTSPRPPSIPKTNALKRINIFAFFYPCLVPLRARGDGNIVVTSQNSFFGSYVSPLKGVNLKMSVGADHSGGLARAPTATSRSLRCALLEA